MKKIEAILDPCKVEQAKAALVKLGIRRISTSSINEFGLPDRNRHVYRGTEYTVDFTPEVKMEIVLADGQVDAAITILRDASASPQDDGGSLLILPIETGFEHAAGAHGA